MTTKSICPPLVQRAATARRLGDEAGQYCLELAAAKDPLFPERAYEFIVNFIRGQRGSVPGESAVLAARQAGIRPHDDRSFGPIFKKALKDEAIQVVGFVPRVRGHGTAGGRLYAAGKGEDSAHEC